MEIKNKIILIGAVWAIIIFAYIIMAVTMPAIGELSSLASTDIQASANTSQMPGIVGAVESAPVYLWFIPGGIGLIVTVVTLKRGSS